MYEGALKVEGDWLKDIANKGDLSFLLVFLLLKVRLKKSVKVFLMALKVL